jgi:uncharacterized protein YbdZ (MbtH family)
MVEGLRAVGKNLTQAAVVSATNQITADTAAQTQAPTNWTVAHVKVTHPACTAWVQVKGSSFVTVFATGKQVFVCLGPNAKDPVPVAAPPGTPGA